MSQPDDQVGADDTRLPVTTRDWDAFAQYYDQHAAHLFRFARLLLPGNAALVEDVVADTFIKVHRSWSEGNVEHFLSYARRTLLNHVMGIFRQQQIAERHLPLLGVRTTDAHQDVASAIVDADAVLAALAALPSRRRTAVVLRYYEDLPYDEIAELMQISVGAVKAHLFAGLGQLRVRLSRGPS